MTLDAPLANPILAPATKLTLEDEPLREKFVAVGTVGPTNVIEDAPEFMVKLAPATRDTLPVEALRLNPAAPADGPIMVIEEALD